MLLQVRIRGFSIPMSIQWEAFPWLELAQELIEGLMELTYPSMPYR